uniref:Uncharacterized protein n=1 Tax=Romanomermis culicivorax TaxID=13658 RepID=A0A915L093_ROMCU
MQSVYDLSLNSMCKLRIFNIQELMMDQSFLLIGHINTKICTKVGNAAAAVAAGTKKQAFLSSSGIGEAYKWRLEK